VVFRPKSSFKALRFKTLKLMFSQRPTQWVTEAFFTGLKWPEHDDHSPPESIKVMNVWTPRSLHGDVLN
jgi:hypothetical protein